MVALALLFSACVAADLEDAPPETPSAPADATEDDGRYTDPLDLTRPTDAELMEALRTAVCWFDDPALAAGCLPPGQAELDAIAQIRGITFIPALIDLYWLDIGWRTVVEDRLEFMTGLRLGDPIAWYEWEAMNWNFRLPEGYAEWKARLFSIAPPVEGAPTFADLISQDTAGGNPNLLVWTGTQPGGVPALNEPSIVHRLEERYLDPSDVVYGVVVNGEARAYPRRILAWHGVANDVVGDVPIAVTYCIPCGGAAAFDRRSEDATRSFGNAGLTSAGRTLLYDEQEHWLWRAFSGLHIGGGRNPLSDEDPRDPLRSIQLVTTTWGEWSARHPDSGVLDLDTGFIRDYEAGAAIEEDRATDRPLYPTHGPLSDELLPLKEQVVFVRVGVESRVYPVAAIQQRGLVHDTLGGQEIVLLSTGPAGSISVYESRGVTFSQLEGSGVDLRAEDDSGELWFVNLRALVSTLDGRERAAIPWQQGSWLLWAGDSTAELWEP